LEKLTLGDQAPDFSLPDHEGRSITLSNLYQDQHVLLVFNIGFV
jgi:peroxiredoxin